MNAEVKKYVSNTDRDIYTVSNIPEEVIAVIFAYVSRSAKSFRDNIGVVIQEEQLGSERAAQFHEKWVLNYGHPPSPSTPPFTSASKGYRDTSRRFWSLSNEYLSFTEYSQRYQKPKKGDFYVPTELDSRPALKEEFVALNNDLYDTYAKINDELFVYLKDTQPVPEGLKKGALPCARKGCVRGCPLRPHPRHVHEPRHDRQRTSHGRLAYEAALQQIRGSAHKGAGNKRRSQVLRPDAGKIRERERVHHRHEGSPLADNALPGKWSGLERGQPAPGNAY
ncbi:MAG: FAD-dependent thymidylate synthase [Thermodesulfobacteriota bacterium]